MISLITTLYFGLNETKYSWESPLSIYVKGCELSCSNDHLGDGIHIYDVPSFITQQHTQEDDTTNAQIIANPAYGETGTKVTSDPAYGETGTKVTSNPAYGETGTKVTSNPAYGVVYHQHQKHVTAPGERMPY